ncbi:hypothetical protein [Marinobacterium zhoushanense]|nr:hypothetical protein [Marinobacterium zhoushanense]
MKLRVSVEDYSFTRFQRINLWVQISVAHLNVFDNIPYKHIE